MDDRRRDGAEATAALTAAAVAAAWTAAADASAWVSAVRLRDAWAAYRRAWDAKEEVWGAIAESANACELVMAPGGGIDAALAERAADALGRGADAARRESEELGAVSRLAGAAAAGQAAAAEAYGRAGTAEARDWVLAARADPCRKEPAARDAVRAFDEAMAAARRAAAA